MKFWNKDKDIRRRLWTRVSRPNNLYHIGDIELKRWCQQRCTGKFYVYYGTDTWWFERPEDAIWFLLRWA